MCLAILNTLKSTQAPLSGPSLQNLKSPAPFSLECKFEPVFSMFDDLLYAATHVVICFFPLNSGFLEPY